MQIPAYPQSVPIELSHRAILHPLLCTQKSGISEYSFANLYLFRNSYQYELTIVDGAHAIRGVENEIRFWIFPLGIPPAPRLRQLCSEGDMVKCIAESEQEAAEKIAHEMQYTLVCSRADFDYLYLRQDLATLRGRKFHKKRNLVNNFKQHYQYELRPLNEHEVAPAMHILEAWHAEHKEQESDYHATHEALARLAELMLCGYILYAEGEPIAFALGEGLACHRMHVVHFEKGLAPYTGVYQYINMAYAATLPRHYEYINREQDMGDSGLRQAKMTYRPAGFVKKYRLVPPTLAPLFANNEASLP